MRRRQGPLLRLKGSTASALVAGAPQTVDVPLSAGVNGHQAAGNYSAALQARGAGPAAGSRYLTTETHKRS